MTEITMSDLRYRAHAVIDRVAAGESLIVTRYGKPVAELCPVAPRQLSSAEVIKRFSRLDPVKLRRDIDAILDPSLSVN